MIKIIQMNESKENKADFPVSRAKELIQEALRAEGGLTDLLLNGKEFFSEELERVERRVELDQKKEFALKEFEEIFEKLSPKDKKKVEDYIALEQVKLAGKREMLEKLTKSKVDS